MEATAPLTVCLCVDNVDDCIVPLHQIASGHVFGPGQHLSLSLHGEDRESLDDLALSINESCYHLVDGVCVPPFPVECHDVTIVLLPQSHHPIRTPGLSETTWHASSLPNYIIAVSNFLGGQINDTSKILVLGPKANIAATILSRRLECTGGNQLLAFPTDQTTTTCEEGHYRIGHQYRTASILCHTVSKWWAGIKNTSNEMEAGIKFYGGKRTVFIQDRGVFFCVPVDVVGEKTFKIDPFCRIDIDQLSRVVCDAENIISEMGKIVNKEDECDKNKRIYCAQL